MTLAMVKLALELQKTSVVVVSECEARTCAAGRYFEFIDNFLPKFERTHSLIPAPNDDGLEELAEIEFATSDGGDFEVVGAHVLLLERNHSVPEFRTLFDFVFRVRELEKRGQLHCKSALWFG